MMTFQLNASLPAAKVLLSGSGPLGADPAAFPSYSRTLGMGAGGGLPPLRLQQMRKLPVIQTLSASRDVNVLQGGFRAGGTTILTKDDKPESENSNPEKDTIGRHFIFDKNSVRLDRNRTLIPPLPRLYQTHRPGPPRPFGLAEFPHSHVGRPFTLGDPGRYELSARPTLLFPSAFVLNGRNSFSTENCKLGRPKGNYPTFNLLTVEDNQKDPSYMDPMAGASRSFIHRISEISSLEGETVRQEKLRKMRKPAKPPS